MPDATIVPSAPWHCDPNAVSCGHGHLLAFYKTGYRADMRRMIGHSFLECRDCNPTSYFLAVFTRDPSPLVICYAIAKDSYLEWNATHEQTPPTAELLYRLRDPQGASLNPGWRPSR